MMEVNVTFAGLIRSVVGTSETVLTVPADVTLGGLFQELTNRFGPGFAQQILSDGEIAPHASVVIDGRYVRKLEGCTPVVDRQGRADVEIVLLGPPAAGG